MLVVVVVVFNGLPHAHLFIGQKLQTVSYLQSSLRMKSFSRNGKIRLKSCWKVGGAAVFSNVVKNQNTHNLSLPKNLNGKGKQPMKKQVWHNKLQNGKNMIEKYLKPWQN